MLNTLRDGLPIKKNLWYLSKSHVAKRQVSQGISRLETQHKSGTGVVDVPSVGRVLFIIWELHKTALLWMWKAEVLNFFYPLCRQAESIWSVILLGYSKIRKMWKGHGRLEYSLACSKDSCLCTCRSQANWKTVWQVSWAIWCYFKLLLDYYSVGEFCVFLGLNLFLSLGAYFQCQCM